MAFISSPDWQAAKLHLLEIVPMVARLEATCGEAPGPSLQLQELVTFLTVQVKLLIVKGDLAASGMDWQAVGERLSKARSALLASSDATEQLVEDQLHGLLQRQATQQKLQNNLMARDKETKVLHLIAGKI